MARVTNRKLSRNQKLSWFLVIILSGCISGIEGQGYGSQFWNIFGFGQKETGTLQKNVVEPARNKSIPVDKRQLESVPNENDIIGINEDDDYLEDLLAEWTTTDDYESSTDLSSEPPSESTEDPSTESTTDTTWTETTSEPSSDPTWSTTEISESPDPTWSTTEISESPDPTWSTTEETELPPWSTTEETPSPWSTTEETELPPWSTTEESESPPTWSTTEGTEPPPAWSTTEDTDPPPAWSTTEDGESPPTWSTTADTEPPPAWSTTEDGESPPTWSTTEDGVTPPPWSTTEEGGSPPTRSTTEDGGSPPTWSTTEDTETPPVWSTTEEDGGPPSSPTPTTTSTTPPTWSTTEDGGPPPSPTPTTPTTTTTTTVPTPTSPTIPPTTTPYPIDGEEDLRIPDVVDRAHQKTYTVELPAQGITVFLNISSGNTIGFYSYSNPDLHEFANDGTLNSNGNTFIPYRAPPQEGEETRSKLISILQQDPPTTMSTVYIGILGVEARNEYEIVARPGHDNDSSASMLQLPILLIISINLLIHFYPSNLL